MCVRVRLQVSCAVRSYWSQMPAIRSSFVLAVYEYFVGIKYYSVIITFTSLALSRGHVYDMTATIVKRIRIAKPYLKI